MKCRRGWAVLLATAALGASFGGAAAAPPHNLVAIEFKDSPPSELSVAGGFLGVPDSSGSFPESFRRYDDATGRSAPRGAGAGNLLVFTDLQPGTYRVALFLLEQSKMMRKLLGSKIPATEDRCLVYGDTAAALTFTIGDRALAYVGCVVRKTWASLDSSQVWSSRNEWNAGDEGKAWRSLLKRRDFAAWRDLLEPGAAAAGGAVSRKRKG